MDANFAANGKLFSAKFAVNVDNVVNFPPLTMSVNSSFNQDEV